MRPWFKEVITGIELTEMAEIHTMELPELRRYITDHREDVEREKGKNHFFRPASKK